MASLMASGLLAATVCGLLDLWRQCYIPDDPDCGFYLASLITILHLELPV